MIWILLGVFFLAALINIPIAYCIGLGVWIAMLLTTGLPISVIALKMYTMLNSFPFLAIPLYIMAGYLMNKAGITTRLINLAKVLIGFVRGGVAMTAILASMFFGGVSGSSLADTAAIGSILLPEMKREGYDPHFSAGLIASSGTLGGIIPPSISMILYGVVSGTSIARLFLAGAIPGVILGIAFMIWAYIFARRHNYPVGPKPTLRSFGKALVDGLIPLGMPVIIVGGIYGGVFTATEAGITAVVYALLVGVFVYRTIRPKDLLDAMLDAAETSAIPALIIAFSGSFAFLSSYAGVPNAVAMFIYSLTSSKVVIMLLINAMLLVVGCFMDGAAVYPIVVPIFLPILVKMGISPVHFGVIMVVNLSIGLITPPVGGTLYTACAISGLQPLDVAKKAVPFILVAIAVLMGITFIPWISEFLPGLMMGRG
jgi:C4-dicarboxylate transporter, DctM subunit